MNLREGEKKKKKKKKKRLKQTDDRIESKLKKKFLYTRKAKINTILALTKYQCRKNK